LKEGKNLDDIAHQFELIQLHADKKWDYYIMVGMKIWGKSKWVLHPSFGQDPLAGMMALVDV
jgi:hypothetical protein